MVIAISGFMFMYHYKSQRRENINTFTKAFTKNTDVSALELFTQSLCEWLAPSGGCLDSLPVDPKCTFEEKTSRKK